MNGTATTRRAFLRLTIAAGGLSLVAAACTPRAPAPIAPTTGTSKVPLPTFAAFQVPPPDVTGSADGLLPPAYFNYPQSPVRSVQQPVGSGEEVTAVTYTTQAPPTPAEQNAAWQRVNQEIGLDVKLPLTQLADYPTKLNTIIAGGSLPDLLSLGAGNGLGVPNLPEFLDSQCMDLTALVTGDAVKAFPNLANLPPYAWRNAVFNNRIYAVPSVRSSISNAIMFGKGKLLANTGGVTFKGADDFYAKMQQLTGGGAQWGLGATSGAPTNGIPGIATFFLESFGAPNVWRESGGKLTKDWETDEFKSAIAPFPANKSTTPVHHLGTGANLLTVLKKTSDDQAKKLLGLLNYTAAPFGTQEYLTMWYGVEGVYSTTNAQRAASLNQTMGDGLLSIIFGRTELSSYDQLVKDWRAQGGDQIRSEFERALGG